MNLLKIDFKVFRCINLGIFSYLLFSIFSQGVFKKEFNIWILLLVVACSVIIQLLDIWSKNKKIEIEYVYYSIIIILAILLFYWFGIFVGGMYTMYMFINVYVSIKTVDMSIDYLENLNFIKVIMTITALTFMAYPFLGKNAFNSVISSYFILIPINIIILRTSRAIKNNVRDKNMRKVNYTIFIGALVLLNDITMNAIEKVVNFMAMGVAFVFRILIICLGCIMYYPLMLLANLMVKVRAFMMGLPAESTELIVDDRNRYEDLFQVGMEQMSQIIVDEKSIFIFKTSLMIIIFITAFLILKKFMANSNDEDGSLEVIEEIENKKEAKKRKIVLAKNENATVRDKILYLYRLYMVKADKKELFRASFTPHELESNVNSIIDKENELSTITDIYREAKFSLHDMSEEKLKIMEENYDEIKNKL